MYLSRIADNLSTMLAAGISVVRTLEITHDVVENVIFEEIIDRAITGVKSGAAMSDVFSKSKYVPNVFVWMMRTGEETGTITMMLKKITGKITL